MLVKPRPSRRASPAASTAASRTRRRGAGVSGTPGHYQTKSRVLNSRALDPRRLGTEWRVALVVSVLVLAAVLLDLTPLLRGPAPYPPEWRWDLRAGATSGRWLAVLVTGAALVGAGRPPVRGRAPPCGGRGRGRGGAGLAVPAGARRPGAGGRCADADGARAVAHRDLVPDRRRVRRGPRSRRRSSTTTPSGCPRCRRRPNTRRPIRRGRSSSIARLIGLFEAAPAAAAALLAAGGIDPDAGRRPAAGARRRPGRPAPDHLPVRGRRVAGGGAWPAPAASTRRARPAWPRCGRCCRAPRSWRRTSTSCSRCR